MIKIHSLVTVYFYHEYNILLLFQILIFLLFLKMSRLFHFGELNQIKKYLAVSSRIHQIS